MLLWQNVHVYKASDIDASEEEADNSENENGLVKFDLECVESDQNDENDNTCGEEENSEGDASENNEEEKSEAVWYFKLEKLIHHMRDASSFLIKVLGTFLSLDETMMCFMGHSIEMHQMKNKPIGEDYKFYCSTTSDGY
eukprot:1138581-Ditylum_brightwellii.AAC.1